MKAFLLALSVYVVLPSFGQTAVIDVKSRHANLKEIPHAIDQFGVVAPIPHYDTLIRIDATCIIQIGSKQQYSGLDQQRFRDTICDHWYYKQVQFDPEKIREYHGQNVVMIGFENDQSQRSHETRPFQNRTTHRQSLPWLFIAILLGTLSVYIWNPFRRGYEGNH
jgi:hypothetical protein